MASSSRQIKQELLETMVPDIYVPKRRRRRTTVKLEPVKVESIKLDPVKLESVVKKAKKRSSSNAFLDDDVELVRSFAKRRPYQWKGRKVNRVLRPGTTVVFTPGERNQTKAFKRSADEMFADNDILEQAQKLEGEFAYGKRGRIDPYVVLDDNNPTPSLYPVTPQLPVVGPSRAVKRGSEAVSTIQLLAPKKRRMTDDEKPFEIKVEEKVPFPTREIKTAVRKIAEIKNEPMIVEDIKVRDIKPVAPGLALQTVDVKVPIKSESADVKMEIKEEPWVETMDISYAEPPEKPAGITTSSKGDVIYPKYRLHPSMIGHPKVVRTRRRRTKNTTSNQIIYPEYRLHPSMIGHKPPTKVRRRRRKSRKPRKTSSQLILPSVRYHPSISMPTR